MIRSRLRDTGPAIYGPGGNMTMSQFQAWQVATLAANAAATPPPPGYTSYAAYEAAQAQPKPSAPDVFNNPAINYGPGLAAATPNIITGIPNDAVYLGAAAILAFLLFRKGR
jgi:hypothetical protein